MSDNEDMCAPVTEDSKGFIEVRKLDAKWPVIGHSKGAQQEIAGIYVLRSRSISLSGHL